MWERTSGAVAFAPTIAYQTQKLCIAAITVIPIVIAGSSRYVIASRITNSCNSRFNIFLCSKSIAYNSYNAISIRTIAVISPNAPTCTRCLKNARNSVLRTNTN